MGRFGLYFVVVVVVASVEFASRARTFISILSPLVLRRTPCGGLALFWRVRNYNYRVGAIFFFAKKLEVLS